jgi:DNA-binding MarR family transcriptional regulator
LAHHHENVGHLLWEVSSRVSALAEARLSLTSSLTLPSLGMLDIIADSPGISIAEIARRAPKSQQAVSQVVARLEKIGLVERKLAGARTIGLHLTAAGNRVHAEGAALEVAFEKELELMLGRDRYERLRKTLLEARPLIGSTSADRAESPRSKPKQSATRRRDKRGA